MYIYAKGHNNKMSQPLICMRASVAKFEFAAHLLRDSKLGKLFLIWNRKTTGQRGAKLVYNYQCFVEYPLVISLLFFFGNVN